jgi:hypothetical protein
MLSLRINRRTADITGVSASGGLHRVPLTTILIAVVFALFWALLGLGIAGSGQPYDFLNLYTGARLSAEGRWSEMYDPAVQLEVERRYAAVDTLQPYVRPPFHALVLSPLATIPFRPAHVVWLTMWTVLYGVCGWWAARRLGPDLLVLSAMSLPAAMGIAQGQDGVWMLCAVAGSYALGRSGRPGLAGAVLALGLAKFHLMVFFPLLMVAGCRWRMLAGFASAAAVLLIACVALAGPAGMASYAALITSDHPRLEPSRELQMNIHAMLSAAAVPAWVAYGLIAATAVLVIWSGVRAPDWIFYAAAAGGALLCLPHTYGYDTTYLLPGLWLVWMHARRRVTRVVAVTLCTPLPFLPVLTGLLSTSIVMPGLLLMLVISLWRENAAGQAWDLRG